MEQQSKQGRRGTDRRAGLTPTKVFDVAQRLSRDAGLDSWTQRDLAAALDVAPSVLYHHVGGRDLILRGVVERILSAVTVPDPALGWHAWFRTLLLDLRPIVAAYPGAAKWLVMHGPSFPSIVAVFDVGIGVLVDAGFRRPAMVYALLLNSAMLTISMGDERRAQADDGPRDHASMLREFGDVGQSSTGMSQVIDELIRPLANADESAGAGVNDVYYRLLVDSLLAGVWEQRDTL